MGQRLELQRNERESELKKITHLFLSEFLPKRFAQLIRHFGRKQLWRRKETERWNEGKERSNEGKRKRRTMDDKVGIIRESSRHCFTLPCQPVELMNCIIGNPE